MKTNIPIELTDQDRRRIRAALGRGGMATRKEIRIFVDRLVRAGLEAAPEPATRRGKVVTPVSPARAAIDQLPDETRCQHCRRPKCEHGRMSLTCPPQSGRPRGERFTPANAVS